MNVLQIVQGACYEMGAPAPSSLYGTTNTADLQLLNLFYAVGRDVLQRRFWLQLKRTATITLTSGRNKYPLPEDFYAPLPKTYWDQSNKWQMVGPLWDDAFNYRLYGYATSENRRAFRIFGPDQNPNTSGGQFRIDPTPGTSGDILSFDYISKSWLFPPNWTPSEAGITVGKYRNASGNIYKCTAISTGVCGTTPPSHTSGAAVDGGVTWTYQTAAYEAILSDTDICLFEDDLMILGLKAWYKQAKGLDYAQLRADYESNVEEAFARWNPLPKISLADGDIYQAGLNPNIPEGGFG